VQSDRIYMSVGIAGLSHVRARECTIETSKLVLTTHDDVSITSRLAKNI